ncbi:MAG: DUF1254 domain-containing protein [Anaeromyxobacteraceae bacterium]
MELVEVTPETYIRAETDRNFQNFLGLTGGVNRFFHIRKPTPLDKQTVIRMNLDTLYSGAVVDTSKGATITIPEVPAGRFISAQVVDNDHYCPATFYEAGTHRIESDTRYAAVIVRIQVFDPKDPAEVALVNGLQDGLVLQAGSAEPLPPSKWEPKSLQALTDRYNEEAKALAGFKGLMGRRGKVDEARRHLVAAAGWGLNPDEDATYFMYAGEHDAAKAYVATYPVPETRAFWSITVYGADGYMKSENAILNSSSAKLNPDGTFTAHFGSKALCGDVPNRLDVTPGWNFVMRVYRPGPSVLDGSYVLPAATPMK